MNNTNESLILIPIKYFFINFIVSSLYKIIYFDKNDVKNKKYIDSKK